MKFEIRIYPNANATTLGEAGESLGQFEALSGSVAHGAPEAIRIIEANRTETTQQWVRGKRQTVTAWRPCEEAIGAGFKTARGLAFIRAVAE